MEREKRLQSFIYSPSSLKQEMESRLPKEQKNFTLGDMYALKLDNLEWIKVIIPDESKIVRTNHCLVKMGDDSLLIFGGNGNNSMYCNKDYLVTFTTKKGDKEKLKEEL